MKLVFDFHLLVFLLRHKLYLISNDKDIKIPNVVWLSSKVEINYLQKLGVKVVLDGVGYVTEQSIPEGTEITEGLEIKLILKPKF